MRQIRLTVVGLFALLFVCSAQGQGAYGGFIQSNHLATVIGGPVDILIASNSAPAGSTVVIFATWEAPSTINSGVSTNSSNYTATLWGTQLDSSVHRQTFYSFYATNGIAAGSSIYMSYSANINFARAYRIDYFTGLSPVQPNVVFTNETFGSNHTFTITTTNANVVIVGMKTSDGWTNGAGNFNENYFEAGTFMQTLGGNGDSIGYVFGNTAGLVSGYFYGICTTNGNYSTTSRWIANGTNINKSEECMMVGFNSLVVSNYYVDYVSGNDTNSGTATNTAWQHCPGDANATSVPLAAVLLPGNTVYFKGGVTYAGEVDINASGSSGLPITFDGNTSGLWGIGLATVDAATNNYHGFAALHLVGPRNYITIHGFNIINLRNGNNYQNQVVNIVPYSQDTGANTNMVNYRGDNSGYDLGGIFVYGSNWVLNGCSIYQSENWYYRSLATGNTTNDIQCTQNAIDLYGATNVVITNCSTWQIGHSFVQASGASNITIVGCNCGGPNTVALTNRGWFAVFFEGGASGMLISNNLIHDGWQREGDDDAGQRDHAGDWLHLFGNNDGVQNWSDNINVTVCYNFLYNDFAYRNAYGTGDIYLENDDWNMSFFDNIVVNPHHFGIWLNSAVVTNVSIYNNTTVCYAPINSGAAGPLFVVGAVGVAITNNILVNYSANNASTPYVVSESVTASNIVSDYNEFYGPNIGAFGSIRYTNVDFTLAAWTAATGLDAHSTTNNPALLLIPADGSTSSAGVYKLTAGSPGKGTGATLTNYFTTDFIGLTRVVPWDMGAYMYVAPNLWLRIH